MNLRTILSCCVLAAVAGLGAGTSLAIPPSPSPCADACWRAYSRCLAANPDDVSICTLQRQNCLDWCAPEEI